LNEAVFTLASEADWLIDAILSDSAAVQLRIAAFIYQNKPAFPALCFVVSIAGAFIASESVSAGRVYIAIIVVFIGALVDILANGSVASEAVVAIAGISAVGISALSVGIASSSDGTLVDVFTDLSIAAESFFASALIAAFRVEAPGVS